MIGEVLGVVGGALVLAALASKRMTVSILLLFIGSLLVGFAVAEHSGPIAGMVVAALYAGALVTLILISLTLVSEEEKIKLDQVYAAALALALPVAILLIYMFSSVSYSPHKAAARIIGEEDVGAFVLILVTASIGVVTILRGGEK